MYLIIVFGGNPKYKTCIWLLYYVENLYLNWTDTIIVVFVMYLEHVFEICGMYLKHVFVKQVLYLEHVFWSCICSLKVVFQYTNLYSKLVFVWKRAGLLTFQIKFTKHSPPRGPKTHEFVCFWPSRIRLV